MLTNFLWDHLRTGWHLDRKRGWVRLFGRGVAWKDLRHHFLMFSERNGYTKHWRIGHYSFRFLKPLKLDERGERDG